MRIIRGLERVRAEDRGASAAIGNFDGVHRGHRAVIELARADDAPLGVVTFDPHPRAFFQPEAPPFRLTRPEDREARLASIGVDLLFAIPFDAGFAALSPEAFCRDVLAGALGLVRVVVGADFRFGARRAGDVELLRREGAALGFEVRLADLQTDGGEAFSSSAIRAALAEGRIEDAERMLGHHHRISGRVERGDERGAGLGYPTANLSMDGLAPPRHGVYAVRARVLDGPHEGEYDGVASLGERPTFGVNRPNFETHLFDFDGDLYGARLSVALIAFLRPEEAFDGADALIAQMKADEAAARAFLGRR